MFLVVMEVIEPSVWLASVVTGPLTGMIAIGGIVYAQRQTTDVTNEPSARAAVLGA